VEQPVQLPDGRSALVRVGLLDPYVKPADQTTVALELEVDGEVQAALNTVLDPADERAAAALASEAARGLGSGALEPTAGALEHLVDEPR
jgi:hypothetical protein